MKILYKALTVILCLLLAVNLYYIGMRLLGGDDNPKLFGYFHAIVLSGSMEPAFSAGDVLIYRQQAAYAPGDAVMFRQGGSFVTHRLMEATPDGFITKGDANNAPDSAPVPPEAIEGAVIFVLPALGSVLLFFKSPLGILILILLALLLWELPRLTQKRKEGQT